MFTYEVEWRESDVQWASRWDIYLAMTDVQIHWFSIINSVVVVFFLAGQLFTLEFVEHFNGSILMLTCAYIPDRYSHDDHCENLEEGHCQVQQNG